MDKFFVLIRAIIVASKSSERGHGHTKKRLAAFSIAKEGWSMKTKVFRLDEISPAEYNPRKDLKPGDAQYEAIRHSIEAYGFVEPLVVNVRDGKNVLVGGHQRYKILMAAGEKETEAVVVDLDEQQEKALNLALNKIDGEWDTAKLGDLLSEIGEDDAVQIGFSHEEYEDLLREIEQEEQEDGPENAAEGQEGPSDDEYEETPTDDENDAESGAEKPFEVYLSFPTQEAAQAWLDAHGIDKQFDAARNIIIDHTKEAKEA